MTGYKIKMAGCHFPGITSHHPLTSSYPECNSTSSYNNFKHWHQNITYESQPEDLQEIMKECGIACDTIRYDSEFTVAQTWVLTKLLGGQRLSLLDFHLDPRAISMVTVSEQ